ncbi:MAG: bifunctional 4-hydroxy-2-oxoglutarate aldolase/2-dehydro-3-deoxy-phosphogluconate aldolase [Anaerolineae bacterium]|nr:bifunctional 4-hydroxy-2-oxoglutarate aldolase/2-dehydro-3-deoxy-phosphogluconate aldolase [Anaerolineae bacterium]
MDATLALEQIKQCGIITVLRGDFPPDRAIAVCDVLLNEGLNVVELTYNSPDWREALPAVCEAFGSDLLAGMGTVLNPAQVREALDGGAQFLVSPALDPASVSTAHAAGVLMAPGVGTATEAVQAANLGVGLIKFFPAGALGVDYFKAMRGPLNNLAFTCNGHMHVGNVGDFLAAGAAACGVAGAGLAGNGSRPLEEIRAIARELVAIVKAVRVS